MSSMKLNLNDFVETGDATKLSNLDDKTFTIVAVRDRPYEDTPGVQITTKEAFELDGNTFNKFYTTRAAIVSKLKNEKLREYLTDDNELGPLRMVSRVSPKSHRKYFDLEEVKND